MSATLVPGGESVIVPWVGSVLTVSIEEGDGDDAEDDDDDDDDDDDEGPRGKVVSGRQSTIVRPRRAGPTKRQITSPDGSPVAPGPKKARHQSFGRGAVEVELPPRGTALNQAIASSSAGGSQQPVDEVAQQPATVEAGGYFIPNVDVTRYRHREKGGVSVVSRAVMAGRGSI